MKEIMAVAAQGGPEAMKKIFLGHGSETDMPESMLN
jgi:hypothetical protein